MSLRITCPNGHRLAISQDLYGKTIRCATCKALLQVGHARVQQPEGESSQALDTGSDAADLESRTTNHSRSEKMVGRCPNGHTVKLKLDDVGKTGRCPKCRATFVIANPDELPNVAPLIPPPGVAVAEDIPLADFADHIPAVENAKLPEVDTAATTETFADLPSFDDASVTGAGSEVAELNESDLCDTRPLATPRPAESHRSVERARMPSWAVATGIGVGLLLLLGGGFLWFAGPDDTVARVERSAGTPAPSPTTPSTETNDVSTEVDRREFEMPVETKPEPSRRGVATAAVENVPTENPVENVPVENVSVKKPVENVPVVPYRLEGGGFGRYPESNTVGMAYDHLTGRLAMTQDASDGTTGAIVVYDMDEVIVEKGQEPIAVFPMQGFPSNLILKKWNGKRLWVATMEKSNSVWLFDIETLQPAGEVSTGSRNVIGIKDLATSLLDEDPFVYFSTPQPDAVVGRLSLETMQLESKTKPLEMGEASISLSGDGSLIYGGRGCFRYIKDDSDGAVAELKKVFEFTDWKRADPGPFGVEAFAESTFYTSDLRFSDSPYVRHLLAGSATLDEALYLAGDSKSFQMISGNRLTPHLSREVTKVNYRRPKNDAASRTNTPARWGFLDRARDFAMIGTSSDFQVYTGVFKSVPKEPWLTITSPIPRQVQVGQPITIELQTPAGDGVSYEFITRRKMPKNDSRWRETFMFVASNNSELTLDGNLLSWTPRVAEAGQYVLGIRATKGAASKDNYFVIDIGMSTWAAIPFHVNGVSFQADSDLAVLWGNDKGLKYNSQPLNRTKTPRPASVKFFVGVFDWRQQKMLRHAEVPFQVSSAAISPSGIYACAMEPARLVRLDHKTLESIKDLPIGADPRWVFVVADRYLATSTSLRFELPAMTPIQPETKVSNYFLANRFGNGWIWEGVLWNQDMTKPQLLIFPSVFGAVRGHAYQGYVRIGSESGLLLEQGPIVASSHGTHQRVRGQSSLPVFPASVSIEKSRHVVSAQLYFDGSARHERRVIRQPPAHEAAAFNNERVFFIAHGPEHTVTVVDGTLIMIPYSTWDFPKLPFHFEPVQSTFSLDPAGFTNVNYSAPGAISYQLVLTDRFNDTRAKVLYQGESRDGSFEISFESANSLTEAATQALKLSSDPSRSMSPAERKRKDSKILSDYRKQVTKTYRELTGRPPQKLPIVLYAKVVAKNANDETAILVHSYLIEVDAPSGLGK